MASGSKISAGRKRRQMAGVVALALVVIPVAVVSRDPSLMAPLVEKWCGDGAGREPVRGLFENPDSESAAKTTTDGAVHANRSAWLESDILPYKPGESP
jgi:hypothetical protein